MRRGRLCYPRVTPCNSEHGSPFRGGLMDFGSLRSVVAWRLARSGVSCEGIVVQSAEAFRLVVVEDQRIVEWTKFGSAGALRQHLRSARKSRLRAGWHDLARPTLDGPPSRSSCQSRGLLRVAETEGEDFGTERDRCVRVPEQ